MSEILKNWIEGHGFPDVPVIDGHVHLSDKPKGCPYQSVDEATEKAQKFMDTNGIDASCILGGGFHNEGQDYRCGNDFLIETCSRLPDRLIGFAHVNPNDTRKAIINELDRVYEAGIRCLKLINSYQEKYPGDGPNMMAMYKYASEHNMLILNHAWNKELLPRIAEKFPDVDFINGHYGSSLDQVLMECPNVYANIWSYDSMGWIDRGIREVGAEKFMFGSDAFVNPMSVGIGPVVFAKISDDEKRQILGLNCARLLDKVGVLPEAFKKKYRLELE